MGLGKTAQSIACLESIRTVAGVRGPFLIVAPLTTLGHWQREIETWTDMVCVRAWVRCGAASCPEARGNYRGSGMHWQCWSVVQLRQCSAPALQPAGSVQSSDAGICPAASYHHPYHSRRSR